MQREESSLTCCTRALTLAMGVVMTLACDAGTKRASSYQEKIPTGSLVEDLRIGSLDGDIPLTRVGGLLPMPDGGVWIAQPEAAAVLVVASDGDLVRSIGRHGRGPGEFTALGPLGPWRSAYDTIWVGDFVEARINLFTIDGDFVRSFTTPSFDYTDDGFLVQLPAAFFADGSAVSLLSYRRASASAGYPVLRYQATSATPLNEVTRVDRTDLVQVRWDSHSARGRHPIPDAPLIQYGSDRVLVLERPQPTSDSLAAIAVHVMDTEGTTTWSRRYPYRPTRLPEREADSLIQARIPGFQSFVSITTPDVSPQEAAEIYRGQVRAPAYRPAVRAAHLAPDGRIWIEWAGAPGAPVHWWVLRSDGEPEVSFTVPMPLDVRGVLGDCLWVVRTDSLDVPYIHRYRLRSIEGRAATAAAARNACMYPG